MLSTGLHLTSESTRHEKWQGLQSSRQRQSLWRRPFLLCQTYDKPRSEGEDR